MAGAAAAYNGARVQGGTSPYLAILLMLVPGCASPIASSDLTGFGRAAAVLGKQAEVVIVDANRIGREVAVEEFIRQGRPGLTEAAFPPIVSPDVASAWLSALGGLERYGLLLAALSDPARASDVTTAFGELGAELRNLGSGLSPEVSAGFAGLAGAVVEASAQRQSRSFLKSTDPHVRRLLGAMASALGESDQEGLRGTVRANWIRSLSPLQNAYAASAERGESGAQRATIATFLEGVDRRDAQLRSLATFRSSLLALADAHGAAAAGSGRPAIELLAIVERRLDETRSAYEALAGGDER